MAFKIGNKTVLHDADPSAVFQANSNLDSLQINGTDVLTHDGTTITLQNVDVKDASGVDLSNLATSVNNNTTAISNNATAILNNATSITNNETAINNNATAITNNATAIANNATAITNTLVDAKAYTDTREVAITTAYTAAIASSTSSGTSSSNSYTDSEIATATTSLQAYTDQAEVDAKAYTDTRETAITTAYQTYSDIAETDAITTANNYTDAREISITSAYQTYADTAEVDANTYTDTAIANLVDTAPTTLDTLNELASALGDDANFSTTVTNSIATKLATADFTSTADTWLGTKDTGDLAEGSNLYYTDARVDERISNAGSQPLTSISDSAPTSPVAGQMWWNSATGRLKIYYSDGDSSQWVDVTPSLGNSVNQAGTSGCLLKIDVIETLRDNTIHTVNLSAQTDYIEIYAAHDDTSNDYSSTTNEFDFGFATNALNGYFSAQRQNGYVDSTVISTSGNSTFYIQQASGINDGATGVQLVIKQYSSNLSSNATLPTLTITQDQISTDIFNPTQFSADSYSSIFIVGTTTTSKYWELLDGSFSGQIVRIYHLKSGGWQILGRINKLGIVDNNGTYSTVQSSFSFSGTFIWNGTEWLQYPTLN